MNEHDAWFSPLGRADLCHRRPTSLPHFLFGCDYYPEHWDEELRQSDPARMRAAGFNVVRLGEFAWDRLEPEEGRFDFALFDETIARLATEGIATIFGTPTATPPRWLTARYPEVLRVNADGVAMRHGSRQHACINGPVYRAHARRIAGALAGHYRDNPHVIGWQIDNEMQLHFSECHCPACQAEFRAYLHRVFAGDIAALNRVLGTAFWAQTYPSFDEIETVRWLKPHTTNPALLLMYYRFLAFGAARFLHEQAEILREANPHWFVTHNSPGAHVDLRGAFLRDLDFLAHDHYPTFFQEPADRPAKQAFQLDTVRSNGGNFLVMEHQSGGAASRMWALEAPEPGEVRLMSYACLARGADGLLYFRWRTCRFGAEMYWRGIIDHDNVPRRLYREIAGLGAELQAVGPALSGSSVAVDIGVAPSDADATDAHAAHGQGLPAPAEQAEAVHRCFYRGGYAVGCIHPADDLAELSLYLIPHLAIVDPAWLPGLEAWVRAGGVLAIGARSGTRDRYNNVLPSTPPGPLRALAGVAVDEYGNQPHPEAHPLEIDIDGAPLSTQHWYESLLPDEGTEVAARWRTRHLAGAPAMTRRRVGEGTVLYVGTYFTAEVLAALGPLLIAQAGLQPLWPVPAGVEVVRRERGARRLWFFLNHNDAAVTLEDTPAGRDLVTGASTSGAMHLPPRGVAVIAADVPTETPAR